MKLVIILALSLVAGAANSQVYTISDKFDDNRMNWWQGESNGGSQHIKGGKLVMGFPENGWVITISPFLVFEKDFSMQATFRQTAGVDNQGFGLVWGDNRKENDYNYFAISSNGYYYVANSVAEKEKAQKGMREWVKSSALKPMGEENILKIEQSSGKLTFFINGKPVYSATMFHWRGAEIGFTAFAKMTIEADDFTFHQEGLKINLPPNLTKGFVKENLGPNINTAADDLMPRISADGKILYFGREYYHGNIGGSADGEDYYASTHTGTGWSKAENLGSPVNGTGIDNISSVSTDNNSFIFIDGNKFWVRKRSAAGWADPVEIGISYENEASHFEACLTPDGKAMLFTTQNKGNLYYHPDIEERDIYVSLQNEQGIWSAPTNLGAKVNTAGDEVSPYMAADGRTLYFASNGRPGFGGVDMYMTKRLGNGWKNWSEPVNLGPEINSHTFDAYYVLPASGDYAYMVSDQSGYGKSDVVRIKLPKEVKPEPVVLISGKTLDARTRKPISADILVGNLSNKEEVGEAISHPGTGEFKIVLPYGTNYGFHAVTPGYIPVSENLELTDTSAYEEKEKDLYLVPIEVGQTIQLNNVFFEQGKPILKAESYSELDRLITIMNENPTMEIELSGHTDNNGRAASLVTLSENRVATVKKYMLDKGIVGGRITGRGYGGSKPLVRNDTEEHRRMNRRVEFKVIKK